MTQPPPYPEPRPEASVDAPLPPPPGQFPAGYGVPIQPVPAWEPAGPGQPPAGYGYAPPGHGPTPLGYGPIPPGYGPRGPIPIPMSPGGQPLANFADRLLAYLIDSSIFACVGVLFSVPTFIIFFTTVGSDLFAVQPDGTLAQPNLFLNLFVPFLLIELGLLIVMLVFYYVYNVEMMFRSGQTIGKKAMKIKVVPLDPAATLDRGSAAKRYLVQFAAAALVPGLSYVDGLWQLWDKPHQQCLHDKFARTVVVKVPG